MAEINIEKKKKGFNWLWMVAVVALLGLLALLFNRGDDNESVSENASQNVEEGVGAVGGAAAGAAASASNAWDDLDLNVPKVKHSEVNISSPDFETRGTENYTVYSLGENLLFDTDKASVNAKAKENLSQIVASINKRYANGEIRIYGHADARAGQEHNEELSRDRAESVKNWLVTEGKLDASKITIHPMGESDPIASNETKSGQKTNRRVEIVAKK